MTHSGVFDYDMPNRTGPTRADVSGIPDAALSALLAGDMPAVDAPASLWHAADVLAALRAEPAADEAAGRAAALAEFRHRVSGSAQAARSRRISRAVLMPLLRTRAGAAGTAAVLAFGGIAAAAYAGALPAAAQTVAHDTIGAPRPMPEHQGNPAAGNGGTPVGPNASGHPSFGLCTAYSHAREHGSAAQKSVAFRNLAKAAGGAGNVPSYCAAVSHPGASQSRARHLGGKPESGGKPHPTGKPPHP
jgi:hypothetical protein